jgi:hypothetical protein
LIHLSEGSLDRTTNKFERNMKNNILYFILILIIIGCNNEPKKTKIDNTPVASVPEPKKKLSNANFIEIANYFNKINPSEDRLRRVYYIYVENYIDEDANVWTDIVNDAYDKPYDMRGMTFVFYFKNKKAPDLSDGNISRLTDVHTYDKTCIAAYWHYPNGQEEIKKYPFKD